MNYTRPTYLAEFYLLQQLLILHVVFHVNITMPTEFKIQTFQYFNITPRHHLLLAIWRFSVQIMQIGR